MACRLVGDNLLSEPMMVCCQLDPEEHISMKFYLKFKSFHSRKCIWKCCLQKWRPSCLSLNVLSLFLRSKNSVDKLSALGPVMTWCHQVTSQRLSSLGHNKINQYGMAKSVIVLTHWGWYKMAANFLTFLNTISWMKIFKFWLRFHWSLFPRVQLTIFQHWFR